jgi:hypothetical protein
LPVYIFKSFKCLGGVERGFTLSFFKIRPHCLTPRALHQEEWNKDEIFFQKSLPEYSLLSSHDSADLSF